MRVLRLVGLGSALVVVGLCCLALQHHDGADELVQMAEPSKHAPQPSLHLSLDSLQAKKVVRWQKKVDHLSSQLKQAQLKLSKLTHRSLKEGLGLSPSPQVHKLEGLSATGLSGQALGGEAAGAELDGEVKHAEHRVDSLSEELAKAQKQLNANVNLIFEATKAAGKNAHSNGRSSKAKVAQLAQKPTKMGDSLQKRAQQALANDMKELAKEQKEKAQKEQEKRNVGIDVTPEKNCKGSGCDVNLYMNIAPAKIDHLARKGHWYKPTLSPLRKQLEKSGNLRLSYGKMGCPPGHAWSHGICELEPPTGFNFEFVPAGGHVPVGGEGYSGHKHKAFASDARHRHHGFHTHDKHVDKHSHVFQFQKQLPEAMESQSGLADEGLGSDIIPAAQKLAEEQKALQNIAKDVESAADMKAEAAAKEARIVHAALAQMHQGARQARATPVRKMVRPQPVIKVLPLENQQTIEKQAIGIASKLPLDVWQQSLDLFTPKASSVAPTVTAPPPKMSLHAVEDEESKLKQSIYDSLSLVSPDAETKDLQALEHHYASKIAHEKHKLQHLRQRHASGHRGPISKLEKAVSKAKGSLAASRTDDSDNSKRVKEIRSHLFPGAGGKAIFRHPAEKRRAQGYSRHESDEKSGANPPFSGAGKIAGQARGLESVLKSAKSNPSQALLAASKADAKELARGLLSKVEGLHGKHADALKAKLSELSNKLSFE